MEGRAALSHVERRTLDLPGYARVVNETRNVTDARRKADSYRIDNYIDPHFRNRAVTNIRTSDIEAWIETLLDGSVGAPTIHASLLMVRQGFDLAIERGVLSENPARGVQVPDMAPTRQPTEQEILSEEQIGLLLDSVDPYFRAFLLFAVRTGARWEEATALQMEDLYLDDEQVRLGARRVVSDLNSRLAVVPNEDDATTRLVPLTPDLVEELRNYLRATEAIHPSPHSQVFVSKRSHNLLVASNFSRLVLQPALRNAGLDPDVVSFHSLRHTAVVGFIREGAPIRRVQRLIGHKQVMSTWRTYERFWTEMGVARPAKS